MRIVFSIFILICLTFSSCSRIRSKGNEITEKVILKAKNKSKDLVDKVFPVFNAYEADTRYNRKRFVEYLEVELTSDVKDVYCYGDFMGIDYKVLFTFVCDPSTIHRIIEKKQLELTKDNKDNGLFFLDEIKWWDKEKIYKLIPFKQGEENKYWQYLWYDEDDKRAYYLQFSL